MSTIKWLLLTVLFVLLLPFALKEIVQNKTPKPELINTKSVEVQQPNSTNLDLVVLPDTREEVPILMYHYVRDVEQKFDPMGWRLSINPADFEKQMQYLSENGYTPISLLDLIDRKVPEKAIVLSFDDGTEDFYTTALPILKKYNFVASSAVIAGKVGSANYMNLDQIKECKASGIEIVSHSFDHMNIAYFDLAGIRNQLVKSKQFFKDMLGIDVKVFVYPSGKYDHRVLKILGEEGFKIGLTTKFGEAKLVQAVIGDDQDLLTLPRIRIDNRDGFEGFVQKLKENTL